MRNTSCTGKFHRQALHSLHWSPHVSWYQLWHDEHDIQSSVAYGSLGSPKVYSQTHCTASLLFGLVAVAVFCCGGFFCCFFFWICFLSDTSCFFFWFSREDFCFSSPFLGFLLSRNSKCSSLVNVLEGGFLRFVLADRCLVGIFTRS